MTYFEWMTLAFLALICGQTADWLGGEIAYGFVGVGFTVMAMVTIFK